MFLLVPLLSASVQATTSVQSGVDTIAKENNHINVAGNFEDDCVILILTNEASLSELHYSTSHFSEIGCKKVTNLSQAMTRRVELQLSKNATASSRTSSGDATINTLDLIDLHSFNQILCLELEQSGKDNVLETIKILEQRADVLCVGPNYIYTIEENPTDCTSVHLSELPTNLGRSVTTNDPYADQQWALDQINLQSAWQIADGSNHRIVVGIIDGGVDAGHPDLGNKVNPDKSATISSQVDTPSSLSPLLDSTGHGTSIAGIIGACTDNGIGISGVNKNVDIVSIRLDTNGFRLNTGTLVTAIDHARSQGVKILNISLEADIEHSDELDCNTWHESSTDICVYHTLRNFPGLIICSAGNQNENIDNDNTRYPTSYDFDNIIVVGANTDDDVPWIGNTTDEDPNNNGSNYGGTRVDLFAPGHNIYTCFPLSLNPSLSGYAFRTGTSFAAPYVAGVASLIWSKYPNLSAELVKSRIMNSVEMKTVYFGKCVTGGRLNAYCAVHDHNSLLGCDYNDGTTHLGFCDCGARWYEEHEFVDIGDMEYCSGCGYVIS